MTDKKPSGQYPIRPSPELRGKLEEAARAAGRTLHAEIIARLEASFADQAAGTTPDRSELRQLVIEELETFLTLDKLRKVIEEKRARPSIKPKKLSDS